MKRLPELPKLRIKKQVRFDQSDSSKIGEHFGIFWVDHSKSIKEIHAEEDL